MILEGPAALPGLLFGRSVALWDVPDVDTPGIGCSFDLLASSDVLDMPATRWPNMMIPWK